MYVVCVLCDVGRRHAVAFRAERRRRHVFGFQGVCMCTCVCGFVCMHVHVCARTLPPAPLEPGCVARYVVCVVCAVSNSSHAASSCHGACGRTTMKAFEPGCRPSASLERGCHEHPLSQDVAPISVSRAKVRRHVCVVVNVWGVAPPLSCMLYFRSFSSCIPRRSHRSEAKR